MADYDQLQYVYHLYMSYTTFQGYQGYREHTPKVILKFQQTVDNNNYTLDLAMLYLCL